MTKAKDKLNDKQRIFCEEYLKDFIKTQAAIRAGYSKKTARQMATRLFTNVNIQEYISELIKKRLNRLEISQDNVLKEFARIAFSDPKNYYNDDGTLKDIHDLDDKDSAAISEITTRKLPGESEIEETKYKLHNKLQALESLGKHTGIYKADNEQQKLNPPIIGLIVE